MAGAGRADRSLVDGPVRVCKEVAILQPIGTAGRREYFESFGIYRRLSIASKRNVLPVELTVSLAYPDAKSRNFRCLSVPETIEWE